MKRLPAGCKAWLMCTSSALLLHTGLSFVLFSVDSFAMIRDRAQGPLAAVTFLLVARMFLYFIAPGWAVYLAVRTVWERRLAARAEKVETQSS